MKPAAGQRASSVRGDVRGRPVRQARAPRRREARAVPRAAKRTAPARARASGRRPKPWPPTHAHRPQGQYLAASAGEPATGQTECETYTCGRKRLRSATTARPDGSAVRRSNGISRCRALPKCRPSERATPTTPARPTGQAPSFPPPGRQVAFLWPVEGRQPPPPLCCRGGEVQGPGPLFPSRARP